MKRPILGMLFALACVPILVPASALAIPIHKHVTAHRTIVVPYAHRIGKHQTTITVHRVIKYDVAPPAPVAAPSVQSVAPAPVASSIVPTSSASTGSYSSIPGVPASFAACVALRESSNGAGSSNIYGILADPRGSGSLAEQQAAFADLYAQYGTAPWAPYDGC